MGKLGRAEISVQIDVGVGDAVTPASENASFPTLLDFPAPYVRTYPVYTVVAEKYEAMVKLGMANTRMKDFHDVWFLARRFEFDRRDPATSDRGDLCPPEDKSYAITGTPHR